MGSDSCQLCQQDAHHLSPRWDIKLDQRFNRQAIAEIVAQVVQVVHAVGHDQGFFIRFSFHILFNARMKEADVWYTVDDDLTVQLEKQPQHAVRARMLRPHIQDHRLAIDGALRDQPL